MRQRTLRSTSARSRKLALERLEGRALLAIFMVTSTSDTSTAGSLRYAITQSNLTPGSNTIDFDIAASGVQTIDVTSALPAITVPVVIDGTSEPGFISTPLIELDGSGAGTGVDGLDISAGSSTIKGLMVDLFTGQGISLSVAGSDVITGDFIGIDPTGTIAEGNGEDGVIVSAGSNDDTISDSLISGNKSRGIYLDGTNGGGSNPATSGDLIAGNLIGTDITGTKALANGDHGIDIVNAPSLTIGGTTSSARNVISGNTDNEVELGQDSDGSVVEGNYIGTDITGSVSLVTLSQVFNSNGIEFVGISNSTIGGTAAGARNVISGNVDGINCFVLGSGNLAIEGNLIGTDSTGTKAIGNQRYGVDIAGPTDVTLGGTTVGAGNVISGNGSDGFESFGNGTGLQIEGNKIGTDITGTAPLGNGGIGIDVTYPGVTIGGLATGAGNVIANNGTGNNKQSGVRITSTAIPVLSNSIYNNGNLGIELAGGNDGQVAPALTTADTSATNSTIAGTLTAADGTYTVQFFATPTLNVSGNAEGQTLLDTLTVTVSGGSGSFSDATASPFTPGEYITATATDATGNTSEFSPGIVGDQIPVPPTFTGAGSDPSVPIGQDVTDTFTITNPASSASDSGILFSDPIPAGVTYVSGATSNGVTVLLSGGVATAAIGDLAAGASVTVTIILSPTAAASPSFTNTAEVTADVPPVTGGVLDASITTGVDPTADLSVVITGPSSVQIGQPLVYTVTTTNNGPSPSTGVIITDTLSGTVTYSTSSSSSGQTPVESDGTVTDSVPTLAAGATEVLTITVIPTSSSVPTVSDSALVSANEFDPDPTNNLFTLITTVDPIADVAITSETVSSTSVPIGTMVTFVIDVANNGPSSATNTVVTDKLPAGLMFLSGQGAAGSATVAGGVISVPVGVLLANDTSVVTIVALTTSAGDITNGSTVSSGVADPNLSNNTGSASLTVTPIADVSVTLTSTAVGTVYTGTVLTYIAVFTNNGPSTATNVAFTESIPFGTTFVGADVEGIAETPVNGDIELSVPSLAPTSSVTVLLSVLTVAAGTVTDGAMVTATEPDPNLANNSASVSTAVVQPMSYIALASPTYAVDDTSGEIAITLVRSNYFADDVTVHFSTFGGNAVAGVDYDPVSETVDFPAGSTEATVDIPILDYPYNNQNHVVGLEIDSPTGSGILVAPITAVLTIIDVNPDIVGPSVTALKLTGYTNSITSIEIDTTGQLNPAMADNPASYSVVAYGTPTGAGLPEGTVVPVAFADYDEATGAIVIVPSQALPGNELFLVDVHGTGPTSITDLAGNPLNSIAGVKAGSDYILTVARGTDIVYPNENGDPVTLKLTGPGTIDIDRYVAGDLEILQVVGGVAGKTVVTGSVHPTVQRSKIGQILGLGQFGSIPFKLTTPAFYLDGVTAFPNINSQVDAPSIDTLLPSPPAPPVTKSKGKTKKVATPKVKIEHEKAEKVVNGAKKPAAKHR